MLIPLYTHNIANKPPSLSCSILRLTGVEFWIGLFFLFKKVSKTVEFAASARLSQSIRGKI